MFKQIKETCIYVSNLEETERFYKEVLKLPLISKKEGRHVFFRVGHDVLLFFNPEVTKEDRSLPPHYAYGNQHIAFEVDSDKYELTKAELKNKGIEIKHIENWTEDFQSFYFNDPEGNVLEVMHGKLWG